MNHLLKILSSLKNSIETQSRILKHTPIEDTKDKTRKNNFWIKKTLPINTIIKIKKIKKLSGIF